MYYSGTSILWTLLVHVHVCVHVHVHVCVHVCVLIKEVSSFQSGVVPLR